MIYLQEEVIMQLNAIFTPIIKEDYKNLNLWTYNQNLYTPKSQLILSNKYKIQTNLLAWHDIFHSYSSNLDCYSNYGVLGLQNWVP